MMLHFKAVDGPEALFHLFEASRVGLQACVVVGKTVGYVGDLYPRRFQTSGQRAEKIASGVRIVRRILRYVGIRIGIAVAGSEARGNRLAGTRGIAQSLDSIAFPAGKRSYGFGKKFFYITYIESFELFQLERQIFGIAGISAYQIAGIRVFL